MPSDLYGNYSLPINYLAVVGEPIVPAQHNGPLEDLAAGLTARMMRSGAGGMTGPLKAADGSVGAPSITFGTALTSGLYKTANGIGVAVAGSQVAEFTSDGLTKGARYIGELIPYVGSIAPAKTVFPVGQTLSRTTYADLWAFAQTEIAAGNTFFNNGNGTTTFGIGDLRGRVIAGKDDMGGSAASRLTSTYFGTSAAALGAVGGLESHPLTVGQIPTLTSSGTVTLNVSPAGFVPVSSGSSGNISLNSVQGGSDSGHVRYFGGMAGAFNALSGSNSMTTTGTGGTTGGAHNNTQPTMICNWLLYAGA
ncbi:tail fiber protein [Bradyrhizobium symbiodeficiens]|uniref:tail fiber protein n=1 Tax=Bradyrhizobium symbiodeficiens TaxID=1404367 RepID=UPI0030CB07FF